MAAQVVKKLPDGPDWTYELKFDGYRALTIKDGSKSSFDLGRTRTSPGCTGESRWRACGAISGLKCRMHDDKNCDTGHRHSDMDDLT
jgi:hypothetical protein